MEPKHIVFLFSDQHNGRVTGYGGNQHIRTPSLDQLASSGTSFNNCYCPSPLCVPSRSAMLSCQLPSETGIFNNFQCLKSDRMTFTNCLSVAGYETVLCGRMHFAGPDQRHGFEKRLVGDMTPSYSHLLKNNYGETLKDTDFPGRPPISQSGAGNSAVLEFDNDVTNETIRFLEERDDERPLYLLVGYYGPHCPYVAPQKLFEYYYKTLPELDPPTPEEVENLHPAIQNFIRYREIEDVSREDIKRIRAAYYGMVEYLDSLIGKVIQTIDRTLGLDNTLIIYASDHGDNIGNNGLFWKTNFYEGSVRVPMVWSCPGLIKEGRQINSHTSLLDIGPTLINYTNGPELPQVDGENLMGILKGGAEDPDRFVLSQLADVKGDKPSIMIRKGKWKLIHHTSYKDVQLFDIENDPEELTDLGKSEEYYEIREQLHTKVLEYWNEKEILKEFEIAKAHDAINRKWVRSARVQGIEEWVCPAEKNYLL